MDKSARQLSMNSPRCLAARAQPVRILLTLSEPLANAKVKCLQGEIAHSGFALKWNTLLSTLPQRRAVSNLPFIRDGKYILAFEKNTNSDT